MLPIPGMDASSLAHLRRCSHLGRTRPLLWSAVENRWLVVCLVGLTCMLSGCASSHRDWREVTPRVVSFEDLWTAVVETATRHHFTPDSEGTDRGRGRFQSRWRVSTPGFGQSHRMRLRAELEQQPPADTAPPVWVLRFCVERQTVPDMARSMNPREQDWSGDGQDRDTEDVLEAQFRLRFGQSLRRSEDAAADR